MKNIINISIEARMTSTRLPGKVLKEVCGIKSLELMYKRIEQNKYVNNIIIATTINKQDDEIVNWCNQNNISYYRGSEQNVYERVLQTHIEYNTDTIVELTGDCPLLDPKLIDEAIEIYINNDYDYVSNSLKMTYPIGMAVQVYSLDILKSISKNRNLEYQDKEHVTPYLYTSGKYKIFNIKAPPELTMPKLSVTLDTKEDFEVIQNICKYFDGFRFGIEDIISFAKQNPKLVSINQDIHRKGLN
jgi:spore coat polysaccharide biosynthesis protein SpsF